MGEGGCGPGLGKRARTTAESDPGETALTDIRTLTRRVQKTRQGFTDIKKAAEEVFAAGDPAEIFDLAKELFAKALPVIEDWLSDPHPNVRRAASEGLRIWTSRPYFRENPGLAVRLLSRLRADESEYVRKSAGNALRDISWTHGDLIRTELRGWDLSDRKVRQTHKLAGRFLE